MEKKKMSLKPKRKDLRKYFTCRICNNLYVTATAISECNHTFCRECIEDKITKENLRACPVCKVDLGVPPLNKLKFDSKVDDLRLTLFKPKPESKKEAPGKIKICKQYSRRNTKKSLSSSGVSITPESNHVPPLEPEKPVEQVEDVSQIPSFSILLNVEQDNGLAGASTSEEYKPKEKNSEKDGEEVPILSDYHGKSLSISKEVVPLTTTTSMGKEIQVYVPKSDGNTEEVSSEELANEENQNTIPCEVAILNSSNVNTEEVSGKKQKDNGKKNKEHVLSCGEKMKGKAYSPPTLRPLKHRAMKAAGTSQDVVSKEAETKVDENNIKNPVWFSLVAAQNQNIGRPLPQISRHYLRVTNGNLPVSYVKKYLVKRLNLETEDEVDVWLRHEPVSSTQRLHSLVDWWVQTTPSAERITPLVGTSAADIIMVLHYSRSF